MGKKRITTTKGRDVDSAAKRQAILSSKTRKKNLPRGVVNVFATYNNTIVTIADMSGNTVIWTSAGHMGFKGTKKSTPFAATIVAKEAAERAKIIGLQDASIIVRGVGPGREAAIRGIVGSGVNVDSIVDNTPMPHNGVKPKKPRRV